MNALFALFALFAPFALFACERDPRGSAVVPDTPTRSGTESGPRVERRPEGPILVLPDEMQQALMAAVPGFHHSLISDFHTDIQQFAPPTSRSAPFAAIGDFNGDGRSDVVVDGHDGTRGLLVAVFTEPDSTRVVIVHEGSLSPGQRIPRGEFISLVRRGVIEADTIDGDDYRKVPVRLERDAFEVVYWQKASQLYYWRDDRFVRWVTSD